MNYYEHHLGDYAKDTAHLTMLEDGAYRRLLDRYYGTEQGIPADQAHRICRARSREEKAAVDAVLEEFFFLTEGVWKNNRAEEEIKKFSDKKPKADEKRESDKERQRRARERRKSLFEELSGLGLHMAWNATTEELHAALDRAKSQASHGSVTQPVTRDNTATQTPDTSHQSTNPTVVGGVGNSTAVARDIGEISQTAQVCISLKAMGYGDTNPHDFELHRLINDGMTPAEIVSVGEEFRGQGKRFRYVLRTAEGRRRDATNKAPLPSARHGPGGRMSQAEQSKLAAARAIFGTEIEGETRDGRVIDVTPDPA